MKALRHGVPWLCLPSLLACQTPPHETLVRAELARLVADEQPPCGVVREYTRHGRMDYRVVCASGLVYRVRVGADGRVLVTLHEPAAR